MVHKSDNVNHILVVDDEKDFRELFAEVIIEEYISGIGVYE